MYLFVNYAVKDWVAFAEIYGMPLRLGKYKPGTKSEDKEVILEALANLGSDAAALIPEGAMIEFKEAVQGGADVYLALATFCNKEISKAVLGQTATTEDTPGKLGAAPEKSQVRQDLVEADSRALENTLRDQLIKPYVDFNFGIQKQYPRSKFHCEPAKDLNALSERDKNLVEMGAEVPHSYIRKTYSIPEPEGKDDPILVPPSRAGMPMEAKDDGGQVWVLKKNTQAQAGGKTAHVSIDGG
jgi:phage gp29-like protein